MTNPQLVEYARFHGIAQNHLSPIVLTGAENPSLIADLREDVVLPEFEVPKPVSAYSQDSCIQLTESELNMLNAAITQPAQPHWEAFLPNHKRAAMLKLDMPTLRSNHVRDLANFRRRPSKEDLLNLVVIDEVEAKACAQERWAWSQEVADAGRSIRAELRAEKIKITKEGLMWAMGITTDRFEDERLKQIYQDCMDLHKKRQVEPLTPMLTSEDDAANSEVTFDDVDEDQILPASSSPKAPVMLTSGLKDDDLQTHQPVLNEIMARDTMSLAQLPHEEPQRIHRLLSEASSKPDRHNIQCNGFQEILNEPDLSFVGPRMPSNRSIPAQFKLEPPLSPPTSHRKYMPAWERFEEGENSGGVADTFALLPPQMQPSSQHKDFDPSVNAGRPNVKVEQLEHDLTSPCQERKKELTTRLKNEKVGDPKLLAHLDRPELGKVLIESPWTRWTDPRRKQQFVQTLIDGAYLSMLVSGAEEDKKLDWVPFRLKSVTTEGQERIDNETNFAATAITPPKICIRSEQMLWRSGILKALEDDEGDDMIEETLSTTAATDAEIAIPAKRKLNEQDDGTLFVQDSGLFQGFTKAPSVTPSSEVTLLEQPSGHRLPTSTDAFSAAGALASFLDLRGQKFRKPKYVKSGFPGHEDHLDPIEATQVGTSGTGVGATHDSSSIEVPATPIASNRILEARVLHSWPSPSQKPLKTRTAIILSNNLLSTHRSLVSLLEKYGDGENDGDRTNHGLLTIIYRDPPSHKQCVAISRFKPLPEIALSPTMAVLLTTLQALSQKPLPGQSSNEQPAVHGRILDIAEEYERVFVVVTHALPPPPTTSGMTATLTESEWWTWTTFAAFCVSLQDLCTVSPLLIPMPDNSQRASSARILEEAAMDENALHCCVWALVRKHGFALSTPEIGRILLVQDETLWSLFLKHCGLNEYAAQVVLSVLNKCNLNGAQSQDWGLRRFVRMDRMERLQAFASVLGKRAVVRASEVLDQS